MGALWGEGGAQVKRGKGKEEKEGWVNGQHSLSNVVAGGRMRGYVCKQY